MGSIFSAAPEQGRGARTSARARSALVLVAGLAGGCNPLPQGFANARAVPESSRPQATDARAVSVAAEAAAEGDDGRAPATLDATPDAHPAEGLQAEFRAFHPADAEALAWYPLEATASISSFDGGSKNAGGARDDDLLTAWTCERPGESGRCALTLRFPEEAEVSLIRVFPSLGTTESDRRAMARVKTLRVHTGAGWVDASLRDWWSYQHVRLSRPVATKVLSLEIEETFPGSVGQGAGLAEVEAYGSRGRRREALELDPRAVAVRGSPSFFRPGPEEQYFPIPFHVAPTWLEEIDGDGAVRRIVDGTALDGLPGDRFLLVSRLSLETCTLNGTVREGRFAVVDRERRALFDAGKLGGVGGVLLRHSSGKGFATAYYDWTSEETSLGTFVVEDARIARKSIPMPEFVAGEDFVRVVKATGETNGFEVLAGPDESPALCTIVSHRVAMSLLPDRTAVPVSYRARLDQWRSCELGERRLLILCGGCGPTRALLLDGEGGLVPPFVKGRGAHFPSRGEMGDGIRLRTLPDGRTVVETSEGLHVIDPGAGMRLAYPGYQLGLTRTNPCLCSCCGGSYRGE